MSGPFGSTAPQVASLYEFDLAVFNQSGSDIGGGLAVILDASHQTGSSFQTWSEQPGVGVRLPTVNVAAFGSLGLTRSTIKNNDGGAVQVRGIGVATAAGTIHCGDLLSISVTTAKIGWLQKASATEEVIAQALSDASDGTTFQARLFGSATVL